MWFMSTYIFCQQQLKYILLSELFAHAKSALNTQQPGKVICRDKEMVQIAAFLNKHIGGKRAGSLYISGAPGTGKTAVIKHMLEQQKVRVWGELLVSFYKECCVTGRVASESLAFFPSYVKVCCLRLLYLV